MSGMNGGLLDAALERMKNPVNPDKPKPEAISQEQSGVLLQKQERVEDEKRTLDLDVAVDAVITSGTGIVLLAADLGARALGAGEGLTNGIMTLGVQTEAMIINAAPKTAEFFHQGKLMADFISSHLNLSPNPNFLIDAAAILVTAGITWASIRHIQHDEKMVKWAEERVEKTAAEIGKMGAALINESGEPAEPKWIKQRAAEGQELTRGQRSIAILQLARLGLDYVLGRGAPADEVKDDKPKEPFAGTFPLKDFTDSKS